MLEEVTSFTVITPVGYLDLLAVHVILNLMVPHSLSVREIPVDGLQKESHPSEAQEREMKAIGQGRGVQMYVSQLFPWPNGASMVKTTNTA